MNTEIESYIQESQRSNRHCPGCDKQVAEDAKECPQCNKSLYKGSRSKDKVLAWLWASIPGAIALIVVKLLEYLLNFESKPLEMAAFAIVFLGAYNLKKEQLLARRDLAIMQPDLNVTPLIMASEDGRSDIVKMLLEAKVDVNKANKDGSTPLILASYKGNSDIVKMLLEAKADVNATDKEGFNAMILASFESHSDIVKMLLEAKADVNAAHKEGFTALIWASHKGNSDIVKMLLEAKADVNATTKKGDTSLALAKKGGHRNIVKLLEAAGARYSSPLLEVEDLIAGEKREKQDNLAFSDDLSENLASTNPVKIEGRWQCPECDEYNRIEMNRCVCGYIDK